jgi:hypothetical protein
MAEPLIKTRLLQGGFPLMNAASVAFVNP